MYGRAGAQGLQPFFGAWAQLHWLGAQVWLGPGPRLALSPRDPCDSLVFFWQDDEQFYFQEYEQFQIYRFLMGSFSFSYAVAYIYEILRRYSGHGGHKAHTLFGGLS